jgi:hypothetical protein
MEKGAQEQFIKQRTLLILWFVMLGNVGLLYLLTAMLWDPALEKPTATLSVVLAIIGTLEVIISVPVKQKLLRQSVAQQDPGLAFRAHVVSWAICESCALLGVLDSFASQNRYYFVLFVFAAIGMLINFPRSEHLLAASYKNSAPANS